MSTQTTTTKKVPSLGATFQTLKDNPRVYDSLRGLNQNIKATVNNAVGNATTQEALNGVIITTINKLKIGFTETLFLGYFINGGSVFVASIPSNYISPLDDYQYSQDEVVNYQWHFVSSRLPLIPFANGQKNRPIDYSPGTGDGQILWWDSDVDDATGSILLEVSYYVSGGAETTTNDGLVKVYANMKRESF